MCCCILNKINLTLLRTLIFIASVLLVPCSLAAVWLGFKASGHPMIGMIGAIEKMDISFYVFVICILICFTLLVLAACGIGIVFKRSLLFNLIFTLITLICALILILFGIGFAAIGYEGSKQIEEMCSANTTDTDFQKAINDLYFVSDLIFCSPPEILINNNPQLYTTHQPNSANINATDALNSLLKFNSTGPKMPKVYVTSQKRGLPGLVTNTQQCKEKLTSAFENSSISSEDMNTLINFLNYFGVFESQYQCSGVCEKKSVYYFSDSGMGEPPKKCQDPIQNDVCMGQIFPIGIGFIIVGFIVFAIWLVQCGLYCRDDDEQDEIKPLIEMQNRS